METKSTLVWSDCGVELDAVTTVDFDCAVIAEPWDTEHDNPFRLDDSFYYFVLTINRFLFNAGFQRFYDFLDYLVEFRGVRVTLLYQRHDFIYKA